MANLFSILSFSSQALQTQQKALEASKNNIANVNTPGYARQRANFVENDPIRIGHLTFGQGANISEIQVLRDKFIEIRLAQEQKKAGYYSDLSTGLGQLEQIFNENAGSGLQSSVTDFFGSLLQLSSDPSSTPLRQNVIAKAETMVTTIHNKAQDVQLLKEQSNGRTKGLVSDANRLMEEIDSLNRQIIPMEIGGVDSSGLRDRRNLALQELGKILDISYYEAPNGGTLVSTGKGHALVTETGIKKLSTGVSTTGSDATTTISLDGEDITQEMASNESGQIGAQLDFQENILNNVTSRLNLFAQDLRDRFNAVHKQGFDLNGNAGTNFFVPASGSFTADQLQLAIKDPNLIASAGAGATPGVSAGAGDNSNARALYEISQKLPSSPPIPAALTNLNYGDYLLSMTTDIANKAANNDAAQKNQDAVLLQLQRQRESVSGVSLDEEATDVLRYQKAFESASRFFTIINQLTDDLLKIAG